MTMWGWTGLRDLCCYYCTLRTNDEIVDFISEKDGLNVSATGSRGLSIKAGIWPTALMLRLEPRGKCLSVKAYIGECGWDLSVVALIWAWKLGNELWGWDLSIKAEILFLTLRFSPQAWCLQLSLESEAEIWENWVLRYSLKPRGTDWTLQVKI